VVSKVYGPSYHIGRLPGNDPLEFKGLAPGAEISRLFNKAEWRAFEVSEEACLSINGPFILFQVYPTN
jgi:hypothetical protein